MGCLDNGLAPGTAAILRRRGCYAFQVLEIRLDRAEESDIPARAHTPRPASIQASRLRAFPNSSIG